MEIIVECVSGIYETIEIEIDNDDTIANILTEKGISFLYTVSINNAEYDVDTNILGMPLEFGSTIKILNYCTHKNCFASVINVPITLHDKFDQMKWMHENHNKCIQNISDRDREIMRKYVKGYNLITKNFDYLSDMPYNMRTADLCKVAIDISAWNIAYVPEILPNYMDLCKAAHRRHPRTLRSIARRARTEAMYIETFKYEKLKTEQNGIWSGSDYREFYIEALEDYPQVIKYISNTTKMVFQLE